MHLFITFVRSLKDQIRNLIGLLLGENNCLLFTVSSNTETTEASSNLFSIC